MSEVRVKVYAYLVHEKLKKIEDVPKAYQEAVKKRLEEIEKEGFQLSFFCKRGARWMINNAKSTETG